MSLNLSNDWQVVDDLQSLSYSSKTGEGTYATAVSVPNAYWEDLDELDYKINPSLLQRLARAVHVWTNQLSGIVPKMSDKIQDQGNLTWYVTRVEYYDLDKSGVQRYRLTCYLST